MQDKTIEILNKYLDSDFTVFPMAQTKATLKEIEEVEKELEVKFPPEFVAHLLADDAQPLPERGLYIEVKEKVWPRPKMYDVGPFWSFLYGIYTYSPSKESEDWMQLRVVAKEFIDHTGMKAVPILKIIGSADGYCIDETGEIVQYDHETNSLEKVNMNFWEVFEKEVRELKERKDKKVEENGKK